MRPIHWMLFFSLILIVSLHAQTPGTSPDLSNKSLITKQTPAVSPGTIKNKSSGTEVATLRKMADDYYAWRNEQHPVRSSDSGLHTWDDRLTDYSPNAMNHRAQHVRSL